MTSIENMLVLDLVFCLFALLCVPHNTVVALKEREPALYYFYVGCPSENISPEAAAECEPLAGLVSPE